MTTDPTPNVEPDAVTVHLTGGSDDLIELTGGLVDELSYSGAGFDYVAFSDGTILGIHLNADAQWRITTEAVGSAVLTITPADERPDDDRGRRPYSDEAVLTGSVAWAVVAETITRVVR